MSLIEEEDTIGRLTSYPESRMQTADDYQTNPYSLNNYNSVVSKIDDPMPNQLLLSIRRKPSIVPDLINCKQEQEDDNDESNQHQDFEYAEDDCEIGLIPHFLKPSQTLRQHE